MHYEYTFKSSIKCKNRIDGQHGEAAERRERERVRGESGACPYFGQLLGAGSLPTLGPRKIGKLSLWEVLGTQVSPYK